ncbi:MAG: MATE family efflux transporter [Tissierellia bacterium]|nr:MATE family efflux transporter [Tissierellia bacterium]
MKRAREIDMLHGPLLGRLISFAIPLILSGILQLLFNAADIVVVGRFAGKESLAAVGATSSLINLLINMFMGVSIGASVIMGRFVGAGDFKNAKDTLHTAITLAFYGGVIMVFVGVFLAKPLLLMTGTPEEVLPLSIRYMRIFFCGMPAFMVYNFGAAIFRAVGDTRRPLYFLIVAGVINVAFNLLFVIGFHMGVAGVALATVISQVVSATLVITALRQGDHFMRLNIRKLHVSKDKVLAMLKIGIPAGLQGVIFNISNVLIQSSVNSFGHTVMAGNTAASNIEGFVYMSMNAIYQTALSFTSQNMGAKKYHRVDKILVRCLGLVIAVGVVMGLGAYYAGETLLGIYNSDPEVISYGILRMSLICSMYALCGMMDVMVGSLRGMGYSIGPMIISLVGACLFRIIWIFTVFAMYRSLFTLYVSYPISWALTFLMHGVMYLVVRKKTLFPQEKLAQI